MTAPERYLPADWPLPLLTDVNRPFFTSGQLLVQRCLSCSTVQHPPHEICHVCQSPASAFEAAAGTGVVDDVTIVHHAGDPRLADHLPYNVALVRLSDHPGVLVVGNVVGAPDDRPEIGDSVVVDFVVLADPDTGETIQLPQWTWEGRA